MSIKSIIHGGREFSESELVHIQQTVRMFPNLSMTELAHTICDHLDWHTASLQNKRSTCEDLLRKLESHGMVRLPKSRNKQINGKKFARPEITNKTDPTEEISCLLHDLGLVTLLIASTKASKILCNEYIERYHYLGYKIPAGNRLRYFIQAKNQTIGCLLMSGASRAILPREQWIGWKLQRRRQALGWVVNNTRFLIFPWVNVPHLASHILGKLARQIRRDYLAYNNFSPLLMETFVDPAHFDGTCYKAANWIYLGNTTGYGHYRKNKNYKTTPKKIFIYPLIKNARQLLCHGDLTTQQGDLDAVY